MEICQGTWVARGRSRTSGRPSRVATRQLRERRHRREKLSRLVANVIRLMIGYGDDETCDERIRCGRHGRRDAGASSGQGPGVVCSRADDDDDDDEYEYNGDDRRFLRRRARQANYDDIHLARAEGLAQDQSRDERRQQD